VHHAALHIKDDFADSTSLEQIFLLHCKPQRNRQNKLSNPENSLGDNLPQQRRKISLSFMVSGISVNLTL